LSNDKSYFARGTYNFFLNNEHCITWIYAKVYLDLVIYIYDAYANSLHIYADRIAMSACQKKMMEIKINIILFQKLLNYVVQGFRCLINY